MNIQPNKVCEEFFGNNRHSVTNVTMNRRCLRSVTRVCDSTEKVVQFLILHKFFLSEKFTFCSEILIASAFDPDFTLDLGSGTIPA